MNKQTLKQIGFWYKNQGIVYTAGLDKITSLYDSLIPSYEQDIKNDGGPEFYFSQLDEIKTTVSPNGHFPDNNDILWSMNIYILTKLGYIKNDNENGLLFAYY